MSEWQPIETAPRDGTGIIAYNRMTGPYNTAWSGWPRDPSYKGFFCGFWGYAGLWDSQPTHWMPHPPPPVEARP